MAALRRYAPFGLVLATIVAAGCDGTLSGGPAPSRDGSAPGLDAGPRSDRDAATPAIDGGLSADAAFEDAGSAIDAGSTDAGPTDPCATVRCGAGARCEPTTGECVCLEGYVLMGAECVAVVPGDPAGRTATAVCAEWAAGHVERSSDPWTEVPGDRCGAGSMPREALDDTVRRVNLFRWLVGLPAVTDDPAQHPSDQACAVMMYRNAALNHEPPMSWDCWTAAGAMGAGRSNLALGTSTPGDAIDLYMDDTGVPSLGHRRWILNGPLGRVGIGFAGNAQCLGVFDTSATSDRMWTAWPNPGPVPMAAMRGEWSFHSNRIAMDAATVSVVRVGDGMTLPVRVGHPPNGYGPSTVSWQPMGWSPAVGQRYRVTIGGVAGAPITYEVAPVSC